MHDVHCITISFLPRDRRRPLVAVHRYHRFRPLSREDLTVRGGFFAYFVNRLTVIEIELWRERVVLRTQSTGHLDTA